MEMDFEEGKVFRDGVALHQAGQLEQAAVAYRKFLDSNPTHAQAMQLLGVIALQRGDCNEAVRLISHALEINPNQPEYFNNLGLALCELRRYQEAIAIFNRAILIAPAWPELYYNLGTAYQANRSIEQAALAYRRACEVAPNAVDSLLSSIHVRQLLCDWEGLDEDSRKVCMAIDQAPQTLLAREISPLSVIALPIPTTSKQQQIVAKNWSERISFSASTSPFPRYSRSGEPIRIGYLSGDFCDHPVGWLIPELIESHDRTQFAVIGYRTQPTDGSEIAKRLDLAFDTMRDLSRLSPQQSAMQIAEDKIDVLVDLQGYTQGNSLAILARRPSRIQITYLGYPGTLGTSFVDYLITDEYVLPPNQREFYSEGLVFLPGCFMVHDSQATIAHPRTRIELGLPNDEIVLCAFSSYHKLTSRMMGVWLRAMQTLPKSVLWLRTGPESAMLRLRTFAQQNDVDPDRLIFAPLVSRPEHLARQSAADLFLDTYPYNQHSTAADALRNGLPLLTLSGDTFASRVAGSLLTQLGMPELIANSIENYESKLMALIHDPVNLLRIRQNLRSTLKTSSLFDGTRFARYFESAILKMLSIQQSGKAPHSFSVSEMGPT
jgi:protein O-GlcNAc transferase